MKSNVDLDIVKVPHDWTVATWPKEIYPYQAERARLLIRKHQKELMKLKAITRIGRDIVVIASGWFRWYEANIRRVDEFDVAANRPEHAAKRFGRAGEVA